MKYCRQRPELSIDEPTTQLKALSNEIAPNPIIFFARENFPPIFRKGSVVFWAQNKNKQTDLKVRILKYLCHPGLDSF
jgi:hypothetical protein